MKILIISDIHANLVALEAVLKAAGEVDAVWCLGDLIGYGPEPNECVALVRGLPNLICVMGNHDAAVLNYIDAYSFNPEARQAIEWTQSNLDPIQTAFLYTLPEKTIAENITLVHGSPREPIWEYLLDTRTATANFTHFDTPYCFVGHTHLPVLYYLSEDIRNARLIVPENSTQIALAPRTILNPGSVGQPRDRDPRAAYAIFNSEELTWEYHRAEYDIAKVQEAMKKAGLPERHIQRLSSGW